MKYYAYLFIFVLIGSVNYSMSPPQKKIIAGGCTQTNIERKSKGMNENNLQTLNADLSPPTWAMPSIVSKHARAAFATRASPSAVGGIAGGGRPAAAIRVSPAGNPKGVLLISIRVLQTLGILSFLSSVDISE